MKKTILAIMCAAWMTGLAFADGYPIDVEYIRASSSLPDNPTEKDPALLKRIRYSADKAFDNRPETAWAENVPGAGAGEMITVKLAKAIAIDEIEIMPGFFDARYYQTNNRIKRFRLDSGDESWRESFTCRDARTSQRFKLARPFSSNEFVFVVVETFKGQKWDDTCLSELAFFNKGVRYDLRCNRINYDNGKYSLSLATDSFDLFPLGEGGYPIASFTVLKGGSLGGDMGPGSQVGMPILSGSWQFHPDCTLELIYHYGVGKKMMDPDEEGEDPYPYSSEGDGKMTLLILGEYPAAKDSPYFDGSTFACVQYPAVK